MHAPLQSPWSPAGYQVVEVSDAAIPVVRVLPQACDQPPRPSLPMGYQVVVVAEVTTVPRPRASELQLKTRKRPSPWKNNLVLTWGAIGVGAACILAFMIVLLVVRAADDAPAKGPLAAIFTVPRAPQVNIPEPDLVKLPKPGAAEKPDAAVKDNAPAQVAAPGAGLPDLAPAPLCADGDCKIDPLDGVRPKRDTFGTSVEFARNPQEAARIAGAEHKLTLVLHVSGNFEEARFT
jgi:hypothetical protein